MRRPRPLLLRLLAALLLLQTGTAFAQCLRGAAVGWRVEICAAEGMRTVLLDEHGRELPEERAGGGFCPACHALPALAAPPAPAAAGPVAFAAAAPWAPAADPALRPPPRAPPYTSRAPPVPA